MSRLRSIITIIALTLGLMLSLPGLAKYEYYRIIEQHSRHQAVIASVEIDNGLAQAYREQAKEQARMKSESLARGSTALFLLLLVVAMGSLRLARSGRSAS